MKKLAPARLALATETLRSLSTAELGKVNGGAGIKTQWSCEPYTARLCPQTAKCENA